jgi:hypothetical protein
MFGVIRTEEKYKPFIISALEGMIAGIMPFILLVLLDFGVDMLGWWMDLLIIPLVLLIFILPSALVLHLSSTLSKNFPDSWRKEKTIVACLTSALLLYAYTYLLPHLVMVIINEGTFPLEMADIIEGTGMLNLLISPFFLPFYFYQLVKHGNIGNIEPLFYPIFLLAIGAAFFSTRGMENKFYRMIFAFLLAGLISSVTIFSYSVY